MSLFIILLATFSFTVGVFVGWGIAKREISAETKSTYYWFWPPRNPEKREIEGWCRNWMDNNGLDSAIIEYPVIIADTQIVNVVKFIESAENTR